MSLEICTLHGLLKDYISPRDQHNILLCPECFLKQSQTSGHPQAVKLSLESKQFFLRWTDFVLLKMIEFKQTVSQMGYSKVFDMKLQPNHPKGSVNELNFQDIQKVAMQALQEHRAITQGNLTFILGTVTLVQMMVPDFLKDLYNIVVEDTRFNLSNMLAQFRKKLINNFPQKQIYKYANFGIVQKQLSLMEERRRALLAEYQGKIILLGKGSEMLKNFTDKQTAKDFMSSSLHSSIGLNDNQVQSFMTAQIQVPSPTNLSTITNPSMTQIDSKQMDYTQRDITNTISETNKQQEKISYEQLNTTIEFLKKNEKMYQQKITELQKQNMLLKAQAQKLTGIQTKFKQLQNQFAQTNLKNQKETVSSQMNSQIQQSLKKQVQELTTTQVSLIQENAKLNRALKDLSDIAQGRQRTILDLQQQIQTLTGNIQLKQKSIQQLNMLISNQEEEIAYRENQVEILGEQIKKKLERIQFLQKSIEEHTKIVSNEELELSYRENEVQTLNQEIQKLRTRNQQLQQSIKSLNSLISNEEEELAYRENQVQILQQKINQLLQKIKHLEQSIHQLNNLIANEEQEIQYRENQVETLNQKVKNLLNQNKLLSQKLIQQTQKYQTLLGNTQNTQQNAAREQEKSQLYQTQLNLINEQNIQLTKQIETLKNKTHILDDLLKAQASKSAQFQAQFKALTVNYNVLETQTKFLKSDLLNAKAELSLSRQQIQKSSQKVYQQSLNEQLAAQVVELQSELECKINDLEILTESLQSLSKFISKQEVGKINQKLSKSLLNKSY